MEIDGPWWGEREVAYLKQVCAVIAASRGVAGSPDDYAIEWVFGDSVARLLPANEGLAILAERYGLEVIQ